MDRQDAKPRRPSLMASDPSPAASSAPSPARILADMDGGKPAPARPRTLSKPQSLILATAVIGLLGAVLWWQAEPGNAADVSLSNGSGTIATRSEEAPRPDAGAATIIDEPPAVTSRGFAAENTASAGTKPDATGTDPLASPFAKPASTTAATAPTGPDHANPFSAHVVTAPVAAARATPHAAARPGTARKRSNGSEPDLMATLLGNIKAQDAAPASGLDSLIRKMEADEARTVAGNDPATAAQQRSRSQQIQDNLRECPLANTAKGLKCRQAICAVYAGRDPACPAN